MKQAWKHYLVRDFIGLLCIFCSLFIIVADFGWGGSLGQTLQQATREHLGLIQFPLILFGLISGALLIMERPTSRKLEVWFGSLFLSISLALVGALTSSGGTLGKNLYDLRYSLGRTGLGFTAVFAALLGLILIFAKPLRELYVHARESAKKLPHPGKKSTESVMVGEKTVKVTGMTAEAAEAQAATDKMIKGAEAREEIKNRGAEIKVRKLNLKSSYALPPLSLLEKKDEVPESGDIRNNIQIIKRTLSNFGINIEVEEITIGPTITRYGIKLAEGIKISKVLGLQNDLALNLATSSIRIEPIAGKSLIGLEVPNKKIAKVRLRNLAEAKEFSEHESLLFLPLGRLVAGEPFYSDMALMPHLLIAGTTGSGKSVCVHSMLTALLLRNSPETLNIIMIDPKRVEFARYEQLPHLLMEPVLDTKKSIAVIQWLIKEMEGRFLVLQENKARDLESYNRLMSQQKKPLIPRIVLIIDEMADLMLTHGAALEASIVRLTQMARATGIHLVLATQRPSVDVITGLIKANIPNRICFKVASQIDSRTVLDVAGAEKLLGSGDSLFVSTRFMGSRRIQVPLIGEQEIEKVVDFWKEQAGDLEERPETQRRRINLEEFERERQAVSLRDDNGGDDELFPEAYRIVIEGGKASTSLLQRKLRIGYGRAARLLDILEDKGIVGPAEGSKPRRILVNDLPGMPSATGQAPEEPDDL